MNNKLNVLLISISFPPKADPECLQTAKYFKYLASDESVNIDVVTSSDKTLFMPIDHNLESYTQGYRQIIKIPFFENKYINFLMRKLSPNILNYPDSKFRFYKKWKYVLKHLHRSPDIIYSRSYPISSTLMAYHLQKELNIPWVLHLSDPWTINPLHKLGKAQKWNEQIENECFKSASYISFSSFKTIDLYKKKYPEFADKFKFFPNVYDLKDKNTIPYSFKKKLKIVYTGGLVGSRTPLPLFKAVKAISHNRPEILNDFEIIIAGSLDRQNRKYFLNSTRPIKHIGLLSFKQALELQQSADLLVVIDSAFKNPEDSQFFPSKLLDYILAKRKIIAITDKNSMTWEVVKNKFGKCYEHKDDAGLTKYLIEAWISWRNKDESFFVQSSSGEEYSAQTNANKLIKLFRGICFET